MAEKYSKLYFDNPQKHLEKYYNDITSPVSFLSIGKIYEFYSKRLPISSIKEVLNKSEGHTLLKPEKASLIHTPTISYYPGDLIQADLFFIDKLEEYNNGIKYILSVIDTYTKFGYLEPLKTKSANEVLSKISLIINRMPKKGNIWCFDRGGEFENNKVISFLNNLKIKTYFTLGEHKAAVCERFQQTIQRLIYKYLVEHETNTFINHLQQICDNYNNTIHSAIHPLTPAEAEDLKNSDILAEAHSKIRSKMRVKKIKPIYKKGDKVRISLKKNKFSRGYDRTFTYEQFEIDKILLNRITPFYILKDYKGRLLRGKFLQHQLTPVNIDTYRGHVIDERIKKGKKEYLFKFKGYDDEYNEWMSASQLKKLK